VRRRSLADRSRAVVVALGVLLAIALGGGAVVLAETINGGPENDTLVGTENADSITGDGGDDVINGLGGNDFLGGGSGYDVIEGGEGDDQISARDRGVDSIDCGAGNDTATVDRSEDGVFDCETVITP
jgi:Ca2+-binding RTX toxin-like protein